MKTLTELSQEDNKRMEWIRDKLINWEISPWQYMELMEENSERFRKELNEILNAERKEWSE
jgi:hypothetical protein